MLSVSALYLRLFQNSLVYAPLFCERHHEFSDKKDIGKLCCYEWGIGFSLYRYKHRYSFNKSESGFKCDLTMVKSGKGNTFKNAKNEDNADILAS